MRILALLLTASVVAGCASSPTTDPHIITVGAQPPASKLLPGELTRGPYASLLYTGLVEYAANGTVKNAVAEKISFEGDRRYVITLKKNQRFFDGSEIKAHNFIDAWNYVVRERQENAQAFHAIDGFEEGAQSLRGLRKIDDYTIQIDLKKPDRLFPQNLGLAPFMPLPDSAFRDMEEFARAPQANGRYIVEGYNRTKNLKLKANPARQQELRNTGLHFTFFPRAEFARDALNNGQIDVFDDIPVKLVKDLPTVEVSPAAGFIELSIRADMPHMSGEEGKLRRQALSLALDRKALSTFALKNAAVPATGFGSPSMPGYQVSKPGILSHNAQQAQALWNQADATYGKFTGAFPINYSWDSDAKGWVEAAVKQLNSTLGIEAVAAPWPDFATYRYHYHEKTMYGAYVTGWTFNTPSMSNFIAMNYSTQGWGNDTGYSSAYVDDMVDKAIRSSDPGYLKLAQQRLAEDLPAIPVFVRTARTAYGDTVEPVSPVWSGYPDYAQIKKK
ncbi:ABC transporter substrate-binding protein [Corynebacterium felinum]|uniref:ABC-type transport system substrate-binding protein n=1 Tax=Corynebacterium felinum TaxID=131318 RepID=A0ABU2BD79_9CORY|nr:ABC transporter substrate-binding protein [Corynebacterium felinum]MDF5821851.1 ABC transporter substrate-binding protein [Corynebacterium felinum]MDR7355339.1 ABC-type transport system substrate-binding protein [Corynebacterium felinum]WJY94691.1 Periplasmic oligopeptide-binding protein precursor [Corynebacterium felinum]